MKQLKFIYQKFHVDFSKYAFSGFSTKIFVHRYICIYIQICMYANIYNVYVLKNILFRLYLRCHGFVEIQEMVLAQLTLDV